MTNVNVHNLNKLIKIKLSKICFILKMLSIKMIMNNSTVIILAYLINIIN